MEGGMQNIRMSLAEDLVVEVEDKSNLAEHKDVIVQYGDNEAVQDITNEDLDMFNGLCDRVLSSLALVHDAMQEMLEFKDEMLKHDLPSPLVVHLTLITGRAFRSISELGLPVGELVRLVRIYSASWEENNTALRKLYASFESKQKQLNIAIRRLQLVDEQSKRMAREKRILNWERLFAKVATAKSHGRRWKFHIETIKEKAKLGLEHVQAYALKSSNTNEGDANLEEDNEVSGDQVSIQGQNSEEDKKTDLDSVNSEETDELNNIENIVVPELPIHSVSVKETSILPSAKKIPSDKCSHEPVVVRQPTQDAETWTHETEFDHSLFIRIFCPEGLQQTYLKCSVTYNGNVLKTPVLDRQDEEIHDINQGFIDRPHAARQSKERSHHSAFHSRSDSVSARRKRFCELELQLPAPIKDGVLLLGKKPSPESESLNIAVHQGKFEEIIAVANINFTDIKQMKLETVYLPPSHEDLDVPAPQSRTNSFSTSSSWGGDSLADSIDIPGLADDLPVNVTTTSSHDKLITKSEPQLFSLYSLHSGKSGQVQMPCGSLPLLMFWGKRARPWYLNKQTGTCSINDLVYAMTGIDITTSQDDLHKEMVDAAISVCSFSPEAKEETVSRSELDQMMQQHQAEMASVRQEYDLRVTELTELISNLQAQQSVNLQDTEITTLKPHPASMTPEMSTQTRTMTSVISQTEDSGQSSHKISQLPVMAHSLQPGNGDQMMTDIVAKHVSPASLASKYRPRPPRTQKSSKNLKAGHSLPRWGEDMSHNFFERQRLWEEESKHSKQELNERTLKEIKDNLERTLAGQNKLSKHEEHIFDALQDVSLPALFMPYKMGNVYNPRAHHYFHPTGSTDIRLTQPPSVFQLPAAPNHKLSAVNLFQVSRNFQIQGPPWLLERYTADLQSSQHDCVATPALTSRLARVSTSQQGSLSGNLDS